MLIAKDKSKNATHSRSANCFIIKMLTNQIYVIGRPTIL